MSTNEHEIIRNQLDEYRLLSDDEQRRIDAHLSICAECATYLQQIEQTDTAIRQMATAQNAYATRNYLISSRDRLFGSSGEVLRAQNRWNNLWAGNTRRVGQLAGVALLLLAAVGMSFIFSGKRIDQTQIAPQATVTSAGITNTGPITITSSCTDEQSCAYYRRLAEQFHQQNPTIIVDVKERASFLKSGKESNNTQEDEKQIAVNTDVGELGNYGRDLVIQTLVEGIALDLSSRIQNDQRMNASRFYPAVQQFIQSKPIWLMPTHVSPVVLLYNQKAFEETGVEIPNESWSTVDLFNAVEKLTIQNNSATERYGLVSLDGFYVPDYAFVLGQLDNPFDTQTLLPAHPIKDEELVSAVRNFVKRVQNKQILTNATSQTADGGRFWSQPRSLMLDRAAMWVSNHLQLMFLQGSADLDGLQIAPLPQSLQQYASPLAGPMLYISKSSKNPETSWLWIKFLVQNAEADKLTIPALIQRAEDKNAWANSALSTEQASILRSVASIPVIPVDKFESSQATWNNLLVIIDNAIRSILTQKSDLDANFSTSRNELNTFVQLWQGLLAKQAETLANTQPITITFGCRRTDCDWYEERAKEFTSLNPDIEVIVKQAEPMDYLQRMGPSMQKALPDLAPKYDTSEWSNPIDMNAEGGTSVRDLKPLIQADSDFNLDDFYPVAKEYLNAPKIAAIPFNLAPTIIVYDKKKLDAAGADYPTSNWGLQEFYSTTLQSASKPESGCCYGFIDGAYLSEPLMHGQLIFAIGDLQQFLRQQPPEATPTMIVSQIEQRVQRYANLVTKGAILPARPGGQASIWTQVLTGESQTAFPFSQTGYGFALLPKEAQSAMPPMIGNVYYISAASQHPDESWQWLKFLSKQDMPGILYTPARRSMAEVHYSDVGFWSASQIEVIKKALEGKPIDWNQRWERYNAVGIPINDAIQQIIDGKTVEEAFAPVRDQLEAAIKLWGGFAPTDSVPVTATKIITMLVPVWEEPLSNDH